MEKAMLQIFQASQENAQKHNQLSEKLRKVYQTADGEAFNEQFFNCLSRALVVFKREPAVGRIFDFAVRFVLGTSSGEESNPLAALLQRLLRIHNARDKAVRFRVTELVRKILDKMDDNAEIDEDMFEQIYQAMTVRLRDKVPSVRCQAVLALARLQDPTDPECPIQQSFLELIALDSSVDVRRTALSHICVKPATIQAVLERTSDVKEVIRRTSYEVLSQRVTIRSLTIAQRQQLLKQGLTDRAESVRRACRSQLLVAWLTHCNGDQLELLQRLDVETCEESAESALREIFKAHSPADLVGKFLAKESCAKLLRCVRGEESDAQLEAVLNSELALYWRCLCQHLREQGAHAEEHLDVILPEASTLCNFLDRYTKQVGSTLSHCEESAEGTTALFVMQQLFKLSTVLDLADEVGRCRLRALVCCQLQEADVPENLVPVLASCLRVLESSHEERMKLLLEVIADLHLPMEPVLKSQSGDASVGSEHDNSHSVVNQTLDVNNVPLDVLLKCLSVVRELLQDIVQPGLGPSLVTLAETLILPGMQTADSAIRETAVHCLGLCSLLSLKFARQHLFLFLQAVEVDVEAVQVTALHVIFDMLHMFGMNAFETNQLKTEAGQCAEDNQTDQADDSDEEEQGGADNSRVADNLLTLLSRFLDSSNQDLRHVALLGFAKLMLAGRLVSSKLLVRLFLLWFNPACDDDLLLKQSLAAFFPKFAFSSRQNQELLGHILLPALDTLWQAPAKSPLRSVRDTDVAQLLIQLTDHRHMQQDNGCQVNASLQEGVVHDGLAVKVANKLLSDDDLDERTLCYILSLLVTTHNQSFIQELETLLSQVEEVVEDKTALRYLAKFRSNSTGKGGKVISKTPLSHLQPTPGTARRTAVRSTVRKKRQSRSTDSSDDAENSPGTSPIAPRRQLSRSCKSTKKVQQCLVFSDLSEEENGSSGEEST